MCVNIYIDFFHSSAFWRVPLLAPNEAGRLLDPALIGDVVIRLNGHQFSAEPDRQNWFGINQLQLETR